MTEPKDFEALVRRAVAEAQVSWDATPPGTWFGGAVLGLDIKDEGCKALIKWFQAQAGVRRGEDADGWWGRVEKGNRRYDFATYVWSLPCSRGKLAQERAACEAAAKALASVGVNAKIKEWDS